MTEKKQETDNLTNFVKGIGNVVRFSAICIFYGCSKKALWTKKTAAIWATYLAAWGAMVYAPGWSLPSVMCLVSSNPAVTWIASMIEQHIPRHYQLLFALIPFGLICFFIGAVEAVKKRRIQNAINHLGLKTSTGLEPQVVKIVPVTSTKSKIHVKAVGIDVGQFTSKKGALESSLNKIVQEIQVSAKNRQIVEITVSEKELPRVIRFESVSEKLSKPYTFLVGEANSGFITGDLRELHHMLIAGATGGGKSVFFKQALIGLLKSSQHIQLYLIDLKRGVEMSRFGAVPNVRVAKNVPDAILALKAVEKEMNRRFELLEKNGFTEIDPRRDKLDRLVVGIDEASNLFTVEKGAKSNKDLANEAREITDKLTKLGRAAGVHVIFATQKVTKETIDTRVQTNIHAKICFRVNTMASSLTAIGSRKAADLPEIPGRSIWSVGSNDIEVQVPYLGDDEIQEELEHLKQKFSDGSETTLQKMLMTEKEDKKRGAGFGKGAQERSPEENS